jgi:hypothetical protein
MCNFDEIYVQQQVVYERKRSRIIIFEKVLLFISSLCKQTQCLFISLLKEEKNSMFMIYRKVSCSSHNRFYSFYGYRSRVADSLPLHDLLSLETHGQIP